MLSIAASKYLYVLALAVSLSPGDAVADNGRVGEWPNFYALKLEQVSSYSSLDTGIWRGRRSLWILLQPDCGSCKTQLRNLKCLPEDVELVAVGIKGTRPQLERAIRPTGFRGQALMATPDLMKSMPPATPTLYIVNPAGLAVAKFQGAVACATLKSAFLKMQ